MEARKKIDINKETLKINLVWYKRRIWASIELKASLERKMKMKRNEKKTNRRDFLFLFLLNAFLTINTCQCTHIMWGKNATLTIKCYNNIHVCVHCAHHAQMEFVHDRQRGREFLAVLIWYEYVRVYFSWINKEKNSENQRWIFSKNWSFSLVCWFKSRK